MPATTTRTAAIAVVLLCSSILAIPGKLLKVDPGWQDIAEGVYIIDNETGEWDTLTLGSWSNPAGMMGGFSPDGRLVYTIVRDRGIRVMNNDGSNCRWLIRNSDFDIQCDRKEHMAVTESGILWLQSKYVHRLDIQSLVVDTVADLTAVGDGSQWYAASNDGLRAYAWMHNTTVKLEYTSDLSSVTVTNMNIWGHGTVITQSGSDVIYDAWSESHGALSGLRHKTWVVYDFETATMQKQFASGTAEAVGTWAVRPCRNHDDYLVFGTTGVDSIPDSVFVLNWRTEEKWVAGGENLGSMVDELWYGDLPTLHTTPVLQLASREVSFVTAGAVPQPQSVAVHNIGTDTLDAVVATKLAAADWLTVAVSGADNSQQLDISVDPGSLGAGDYTAQVAVSAGNAANTDTMTVTLTVGTDIVAPTDLSAELQYNGVDVLVRWNDNADNETGYIIERSVDGGAFEEIARTAENAVSYVDTSLAAGAYTYRVRGFGTGQSAATNEATVTVDGAPLFEITAPAAGDTVYAGDTLHVRWTTVLTNNVEIKLSLNEGETYTTITEHGGITDEMASWGDFAWVVPADYQSSGAQVMVNAYQDMTVSLSSGVFTIAQPAAVRNILSRNRTHTPAEATVFDLRGRQLCRHDVDTPALRPVRRAQGITVVRVKGAGLRVYELRVSAGQP